MAAESDASGGIIVGDRVQDKDGFLGTVRYIGPVATSKSAETIYAGERGAARRASWVPALCR